LTNQQYVKIFHSVPVHIKWLPITSQTDKKSTSHITSE